MRKCAFHRTYTHKNRVKTYIRTHMYAQSFAYDHTNLSFKSFLNPTQPQDIYMWSCMQISSFGWAFSETALNSFRLWQFAPGPGLGRNLPNRRESVQVPRHGEVGISLKRQPTILQKVQQKSLKPCESSCYFHLQMQCAPRNMLFSNPANCRSCAHLHVTTDT